MKTIALIIMVSLILLPINVSADLYRWIDKDGVQHVTNQLPPPEQESYEKIETPSKKETVVPKKSLSSSKKDRKPKRYLRHYIKCRLSVGLEFPTEIMAKF